MATNQPAGGDNDAALSDSGGAPPILIPPPLQTPTLAHRADSAEWLRVTLSSIGDGVITTDPQGLVTFLNSVAQSLTGWTQEDAAGMPIDRIFDIVNHQSRERVENPTVRALREGTIVGLANHTLLIAKDGVERPIDDSAAPIRNESGQVAGAILVFRDVTERDARDTQIRDALDFATNILETQREPFLVLDKSLRVVAANRSFYKTFHAQRDTTEGRFVYDLGDGQWNIPRLRTFLEEVLPQNQSFDGFEVEHDFPGVVGCKVMRLNARRILRPGSHSELILLAIEDITDRNRHENLLTSQHEILELAARGAGLDRVLDLLVRAAQRYFGAESRAMMFIVEPDGRRLRFVVAAGMSDEYIRAVDQFHIGPDSPSCGLAAFTGRTVVVPDVGKDPLWKPFLGLAQAHDIVACWSHPMRTPDGSVLGTIAIYHRTVREPRAGDLEAISLLGHSAAMVIEKHRVLEQQALAEKARTESEVRYRRLFETAKDGILILDAHTGKVTEANAFICGLTGLDVGEIIGRELYEIGMYNDVEENKAAFRELQRVGYIRHDHLPVQNRRGETVAVEFIANVYREGDDLVAQCNIRDISERSRLERQIARQTEALAEQALRKDEFLAMLSHELRNPLAPIRSAVHLLRLQERGAGNPIQQQAREIIERQVAHLTRMVSDLSEVSRVVSGRIRLDMQPVDLRKVVEHALQAVTPLFEQRRHEVSVHLSADSMWVQADPTRLEEVLVNLFNNAAKYTPDGGRIDVAAELGVEGGKDYVLLRVRDNGVGIEKDLLPRIFDLFTQADRSLARSAGGLGIGLSLVQRLITLHGGTIWAHSQGPGTGSEFIVKLPLIPEPVLLHDSQSPRTTVDPDNAKATGVGVNGDAIRVLVVDDNFDLVTMLTGALRYKGYSVQSAHTGPDGLAIARQWRPDIALLDIGLPGLDGYEVARRIRADPVPVPAGGQTEPRAGHTPMKLIAITGYGQDSDVALAMEAGFDGHLVKPCDFDELEKLMTAPGPRT